MTWRAVDAQGRDLATGRAPRWPGSPSPAATLAAAPVVPWPVAVVASDGRGLTVGQALGPGGDRVERLLDALLGPPAMDAPNEITPAGPMTVVPLREAVEAAARVEPQWLAGLDGQREAARRALVEAGREAEMEAALHVTMLVGTERLDPDDDADVDAHIASGAQLWLLTGAVVSALTGAEPDPFEPWGRLVAAGWWPVGPSQGRLVVCEPA